MFLLDLLILEVSSQALHMKRIKSGQMNRERNHRIFSRKPRFTLSLLLLATGTYSCHSGFVGAGLFQLEGLLLLHADSIAQWGDRFDSFSRAMSFRPGVLAGAFLGVVGVTSIVFGLAEPAHAQFLQGSETWLESAIPGMDKTLVSLIFNVLRAIFVIYIAINVVQVIQSARQGDDWQTLARTPLIVVVAVTLGDTLANMVTGAGSTG